MPWAELLSKGRELNLFSHTTVADFVSPSTPAWMADRQMEDLWKKKGIYLPTASMSAAHSHCVTVQNPV